MTNVVDRRVVTHISLANDYVRLVCWEFSAEGVGQIHDIAEFSPSYLDATKGKWRNRWLPRYRRSWAEHREAVVDHDDRDDDAGVTS